MDRIGLRERRDGLAITAAATILSDSDDDTEKARLRRGAAGWQTEAWNAYDCHAEISYAATYQSNALSRVRLVPAVQVDPREPPVVLDPDGDDDLALTPEERAAMTATISRLGAGEQSIAEIQRLLALNLFIAGDGYLVGYETDEGEVWDILSVEELVLSPTGRGYARRGGDNSTTGTESLPEDAFIARLYQRHPRRSAWAHSSMRSVLGLLEELGVLTDAIYATARSRIPQGVMVLSRGVLAGPVDETMIGQRDEAGQDPSVQRILEHFEAPIKNRRSSSATTPLMLFVDGEVEKAAKLLEFGRQIDATMASQRAELIPRIATGINLPAEVLTGKADLNHWCMDDQTEALTHEGWAGVDGLAVGTEVLTLNHESGLSEWCPIELIYRADVSDEPMVAIEAMAHSSMSTPNHRWPTLNGAERQWRTSETLRHTDRFTTGAPCAALPTEAKWSDAFVELLAWYWTEGSTTRSGMVTIAQSHGANPDRVARIRAALRAAFGPARSSLRQSTEPAWRESIQANRLSHGGPVTVFHLNTLASRLFIEAAPRKCVRLDLVQQLTAAQLALFIDVSLQGDGWHYSSGKLDIFQSEPARLDALELAGILAGYSTTRRAVTGGFAMNLARKATFRPVKAASAAALRPGTTGASIATQRYTGTIWCPVTANKTWLARRSGTVYYTGNTAWLVSDDSFKNHLEPDAQQMVGALTAGYYRPHLAKMGIENVGKCWIWYDATPLTSRPNKAQDYKDGYENYEVSGEAYRRELGIADEDKPEPEEVAARLYRHALERITVNTDSFPSPEQIEAGLEGEGAPIEGTSRVVSNDATPAVPVTNETTERGPAKTTPPSAQASVPPIAALTASAAIGPLGPRLAQIERTLRLRLLSEASAAMERTLERAGNRLRSLANKSAPLRAKVAGIEPLAVAGTLGAEAVASLATSTEDVVAAAGFGGLEAKWNTLVCRAQEQALAGIDEHGELDEADAQRIAAEMEMQRAEGWSVLLAGLLGLAGRLLYEPSQPMPQRGEWADYRVPPGMVREALERAGGGRDGEVPTDLLNGSTVHSALEAAGLTVTGFTWATGDPDRPFEPHQALDGETFADWSDPRLENPDDFPDAPIYEPQDHEGCLCATVESIARAEVDQFPGLPDEAEA